MENARVPWRNAAGLKHAPNAILMTLMAVPFSVHAEKPQLWLAVHVYNLAHAPASIVTRAKREAGRILADAGVQTLWVECPITSQQTQAAVATCRERKLTNLTLRIIPEAAGGLSKEMLGFALPAPEGAIHATIFGSEQECERVGYTLRD